MYAALVFERFHQVFAQIADCEVAGDRGFRLPGVARDRSCRCHCLAAVFDGTDERLHGKHRSLGHVAPAIRFGAEDSHSVQAVRADERPRISIWLFLRCMHPKTIARPCCALNSLWRRDAARVGGEFLRFDEKQDGVGVGF